MRPDGILATILLLSGLMNCALAPLCAAEPTLKLGNPAPKLQTGKWVQGEPVKEFEKGKVYVVDFWATWCGPCKATIPHLNELYQKFKDKGLMVIGQHCLENDESKVEPFIKSLAEKMTYPVALDDKTGSEKGKMAETWMQAAGYTAIPNAFLVDAEGMIVWIGHPVQLKDAFIEKVLAGEYDWKQAVAEFEEQQKRSIELNTLWRGLTEDLRKEQWDAALAKLDRGEQLMPDPNRLQLRVTRFRVLLSKNEVAAANALAKELLDKYPNSPNLQNELAWLILTHPKIAETERNLDLAEKLITRANEFTKGANPQILDTLARLQFMQGKKAEATVTQEKAVAKSDGKMRTHFQKILESYKNGELPKPEGNLKF